MAVVVAVARLSGWTRLADTYPGRTWPGGRRFRFQSGRMRYGAAYGGCLDLAADPSGLYLSVFFLFRPGHPPLFVPWPDVSLEERSGHLSLHFARVPDVPLVLARALVAELSEASAGVLALPTAR